MQLVFVALRGGASLQIADIGIVVGDDHRAFELPRFFRVDAEIGGQLHRATHAFGDIDERPVRKHRGIQAGEKVVRVRHDRPQIFFHQIGVVLHGFGNRRKDNALLGQPVAERRRDGNAVEHSVNGDAGQHFAFVQRHAKFFIGFHQLRINFRFLVRFRRGVIINVLIVDRRIFNLCPARFRHGQPVAVGFQPEIQQPFGFVFFGRNIADDVFVQPFRRRFRVNIRFKPVMVRVRNGFQSRNLVLRHSRSSDQGGKIT